MMTPFDAPNAELAWMFLQSLSEGGDLDEGFALLSDDFSYWSLFTRETYDKEALRRVTDRRKQSVELTIDLLRCINEGETVVVEAYATGTNSNGEQYDTPFVCIFETSDGLIVSMREYSDTRAYPKLLGG
ncbi:nuclear transport factor 2 family protein [Mycobacterium sp. 050272]|uniref:nuclear transport factor 2 family protein n=1 Tax=Mycobacterium sp. 050272 TaxID=3142488 RepID=UPI00319D364B